MSKINDGGTAFPNRWYDGHEDMGMTLRDWFAGQALPAVIAATSSGQHNPRKKEGEQMRFAIARDAYAMADAMLAAREDKP